MKRDPIIVIGMHRSGTSVLTKVLEEAGVFFGHKKDENDEALFFQKLNIWMLGQVHASWDNPYNAAFIDERCRQHLARVAARHCGNISRIEFLGTTRFFKYRDVRDLNCLWGWKDPRNTFTFSVWKALFPNAKVIHIYRNPIDVAHSLKQRENSIIDGPRTMGDRIKESILRGKVSYLSSPRLQHIGEGIKLWTEYARAAIMIEKSHGPLCLSLKYETFLSQPEEQLRKVCDFLEMPGLGRIPATPLNDQRRYAFLKDQSLVEEYERIKTQPLMQELGYDNIR